MKINSAKDLDVFKKAYTLAMIIFEISKGFPKGRALCTDRPNKAIIAFGMLKLEGSLGKASL